ncbi:MAG: response regulator transcription factor [bacterium]|nr:response regulator transcription factor [bacterium]
MKILIADDDAVTRRTLEALMNKWGYTVLVCSDGAAAYEKLQAEEGPILAILDWMMPFLDGLQVCDKLKQTPRREPTYVILLTAKERGKDIVAGLQAGADDYVTKPFDREELLARVQVGIRVVDLQLNIAARVSELEDALVRVRQLGGLLPICSYCKKIRNDHNYWEQVESYITDHSDAQFSHSICPGCYDEHAKPELEKFKVPDRRHSEGL